MPTAGSEAHPPGAPPPEDAQAVYQVTFHMPHGLVQTVPASGEEHILDAARRAGLTLPSRCEQGWDLVCAVKVISGQFDQTHARRYYDQDRSCGFALICTARARSDMVVQTHQSRAMRDARHAHGLPAPRAV